MVHASPLSIGTLFSYLGVIAISVAYAATLLIRAIIRRRSKGRGISLHSEPVS
jgi:hypothetical protein